VSFLHNFSFLPAKIAGVCLLAGLLWACERGDENITLDDKNRNNPQVRLIDTFTVTASTVLLDSIPTLNGTRLLAGRYQDDYLGNTEASTYFQMDLPNRFTVDSKAVFDSLVLYLPYDYFFADTNKNQTLNVYPLSKPLDGKINYYNSSRAAYQMNAIGKTQSQFVPRPRSRDSVKIRLDDIVGNNILEAARGDKIAATEDWLRLFPGLALIPGSLDNGAVLGFQAAGTQMRLYYHENDDITTRKTQLFNMGIHFNRIVSDRKNTALASLKEFRQAIPSRQTNEQLFIQAGVGLAVRLDFPGIQQLQNLGKGYGLNAVSLSLRSVQSTQKSGVFLPRVLTFYSATDNNQLKTQLRSSYSQSVQGVGGITNPGTGEVQYTAELLEYVNQVLRSTNQRWDGLMIVPDAAATELSRLVIGGDKNPEYRLKLQVYLTVFPE
jgi:hypothetical protein